MDKIGIIFFIAWMTIGCTLDSFFDGGAPVTIGAAVVAIGCVVVTVIRERSCYD